MPAGQFAVGGLMIKPYYERNGFAVFHGDCLEVLSGLGQDFINLVWTDVPYSTTETGIEFDDEYRQFMLNRFSAVATTMRDRTPLLLCCSPPQIFLFKEVMDNTGLTYKGLHAWCCRASFYPTSFWNPSWEPLLLYGKGKLTTLVKEGGIEDVNYNDSSVFTRPRGSGHPGEKPLGLIKKYIIATTKPGDIILDPFAGTGTTLRAAKDLGRKAIGIELNEKYCEMIALKLAQETLEI